MYITPEVHSLLCDMGLVAIISILATCAAMVFIPWIWRKTRFIREEIEIELAYAIGKAILRHRHSARRRAINRRYKALEKAYAKVDKARERFDEVTR